MSPRCGRQRRGGAWRVHAASFLLTEPGLVGISKHTANKLDAPHPPRSLHTVWLELGGSTETGLLSRQEPSPASPPLPASPSYETAGQSQYPWA